MIYHFIDRVFPSVLEVQRYQAMERENSLLSVVRTCVEKYFPSSIGNPFDLSDRECLASWAVLCRDRLALETVSPNDIEKIYWGIVCPKISKKPLDELMKERIRRIWVRDRNVSGIAKTLYEINNNRRKNKQFYEGKNRYTPLHKIQKFLNSEGLESWSQGQVDSLMEAVLAYDNAVPSISNRKGVRSLDDFYRISQMPSLQGVEKNPEQMMDEWNQRSSIWLIGQEVRENHKALLLELYQMDYTPEQISEIFASRNGGLYYPDRVVKDFCAEQDRQNILQLYEDWS